MAELKLVEDTKTDQIKEYLIPVSFEMCGILAIKAHSLKDAINMAIRNQDSLPLPMVRNYVDGSYQVETDPAIIQNYTAHPAMYRKSAERVDISTRAVLSGDEDTVASVLEGLTKNEGYCPRHTERTPDTKCLCKEFREETPVNETCPCGLHKKIETVE